MAEKDILNEEELENQVDEETPEEEEEEVEIEGIDEGIVPALIDKDLVSEVKIDFLDYAMSVIVSRALPDVRDGL